MTRIEIEGYPDEWAEIRDKRGWRSAKAIQNAALRVSADPSEESGFRADVDLVEQGLLKLTSAITSWSFDQTPSREFFESDDFNESLGEALIAAIDEHYEAGARSDEERKT